MTRPTCLAVLLLITCSDDSSTGGSGTDSGSSTGSTSATGSTATGTSSDQTSDSTGGGTGGGTGGTTDGTGSTNTTGGTGGTGSTGTTSGTGTTSDGGSWDEDYPSCENLAPDACGGDNCCATDAVPGGWFAMGRGQEVPCASMPQEGEPCTQTTATCFSGNTWGCPTGTWMNLGGNDAAASNDTDELPEHTARVDFYGLDRYEVTVGRMRRFVETYDKAALLSALDGGAGAHPTISGLDWQSAWDGELPDNAGQLQTELTCDVATWTDDAGDNETYPINCVSWYLAYAFCAWDEGRLPTAAEWERAAIGGDENRLYPWGSDAPNQSLANYSDTDATPLVDVFTKPGGAGRWSHRQIAGSVWEWVFDTHHPDWYAGDGNDCQNCANEAPPGAKVMRGGDFQYNAISLRGAERFPGTAGADWRGSGIRCARD